MQKLKDILGSKEEIRARSGSYESNKGVGGANAKAKTKAKAAKDTNVEGRVWCSTDPRGFLALPSGIM